MKFKTLLVLFLAGIWGIGSWWWYTCQIKGFCGAPTADGHYADVEHDKDNSHAATQADHEAKKGENAETHASNEDTDRTSVAANNALDDPDNPDRIDVEPQTITSQIDTDAADSETESEETQDVAASDNEDDSESTETQLAMDTKDQAQAAKTTTTHDNNDDDPTPATDDKDDKADADKATDTTIAELELAETDTTNNSVEAPALTEEVETIEPSTGTEQTVQQAEQEQEQETDTDQNQDTNTNDTNERAAQDTPSAPSTSSTSSTSSANTSSDELVIIETTNQRSPDGALQGARLYFPFSASEAPMSTDAQTYFDQVIAYLNANPNARITLVGHTDSVGLMASNQKLGLKRANEVRDFMIQQGAAAQQIVAESKGESEPIADNRFTPGRQKNRRVELIPTTTTN